MDIENIKNKIELEDFDKDFINKVIKTAGLVQMTLSTKIIGVVNQKTFNKLYSKISSNTLLYDNANYDFCICGYRIQVDNNCKDNVIMFKRE